MTSSCLLALQTQGTGLSCPPALPEGRSCSSADDTELHLSAGPPHPGLHGAQGSRPGPVQPQPCDPPRGPHHWASRDRQLHTEQGREHRLPGQRAASLSTTRPPAGSGHSEPQPQGKKEEHPETPGCSGYHAYGQHSSVTHPPHPAIAPGAASQDCPSSSSRPCPGLGPTEEGPSHTEGRELPCSPNPSPQELSGLPAPQLFLFLVMKLQEGAQLLPS